MLRRWFPEDLSGTRRHRHCRSAAVIVQSTSTARNYFDELITLCGFLLTSTINFEFPQTFALYSSPWWNNYYSSTDVTRSNRFPRNSFTLLQRILLFFFVIKRQRELFVIISTIREYRYYPPFLERKKLSQLFVNPRERHFSRLRRAI